MPSNVKTATGFKDIIDRKVSNGNGAYTDIKRTLEWKADGNHKTLWQGAKKYFPTWHPRWAMIDVEGGYTEFQYTDENGSPVTPVLNDMAVACVGSRQNGTIYYFARPFMYKKHIVDGVVDATATVLWHRDENVATISINEETGATFLAQRQSWNAQVIRSIESSTPFAWLVDNYYGNSSVTCALWVNNKILLGHRLYDGTTLSYTNIMSLATTGITRNLQTILQGNSRDGFFIQEVSRLYSSTIHTNVPVHFRVRSYNMDRNTSSVLFNFDTPDTIVSAGFPIVVRDASNDSFLVQGNFTNGGGIVRTTDGRNFSDPLPGTPPATLNWSCRHFQHININWSVGKNFTSSTGTWWDGNTNRVGATATANSLFPGYINGHFYAGKKMLVNGNRLYDIVPK